MIEERFFATLVFIFVLALLFHVAYAESSGSLTATITFPNGDRANYFYKSVKIYQDNNQGLYQEIKPIPDNPFNIVSLPLYHKYKIEVYADGVHASTDYVYLEKTHQGAHITIPNTRDLLIVARYHDETPIANAAVYIKSKYNETLATSSTDLNGQTLRFALEPTIAQGDYYTADVKIGEHLLYSYSPVFLPPKINPVINIVTPWTSVVSGLITAKIYNNQSNLVSPSDGTFVVDLLDSNGNKISESPVNKRGEAYFHNPKVGDYLLDAINLNGNSDWGSSLITIDGTKFNFQIMKRQNIYATDQTQLTSLMTDPIPMPTATSKFPAWIKNIFLWYGQGKVSEDELVSGLQYLIKSGIIKV